MTTKNNDMISKIFWYYSISPLRPARPENYRAFYRIGNTTTSPTGWSNQEPQNSYKKIFQPSLSHSIKPIFLRFIVFFTVHLLKVSNGETETELFWGSWLDQPVVPAGLHICAM